MNVNQHRVVFTLLISFLLTAPLSYAQEKAKPPKNIQQQR